MRHKFCNAASVHNNATKRCNSGANITLQVKDSTGDDIREGVRVTSQNVEDLKDSKGQCNFQLKFVKDARRSAYLSVIPVKGLTRGMKGEDDRKWVPIIGFDCRGLDVVGFHPEVIDFSIRNFPGG